MQLYPLKNTINSVRKPIDVKRSTIQTHLASQGQVIFALN